MKKDEKATLWESRIQEFRSSGLTCKAWCQENQIALSTMHYWKQKLEDSETENLSEPVFAKMPSERELTMRTLTDHVSPVRIVISGSIRIEVQPSCPPELLCSLIKALKENA